MGIFRGISLSATRLMTPQELSRLPRTISAGLVNATLRKRCHSIDRIKDRHAVVGRRFRRTEPVLLLVCI